VPQLSSSQIIDVNERMNIVNDNPSGVKRAVLIGINYAGQQGELSGCHNDVKNISSYLQEVQGFRPQNMITLMDDGVLYMTNPNHYLTSRRKRLDNRYLTDRLTILSICVSWNHRIVPQCSYIACSLYSHPYNTL
jgi:hypothetical protein